MLRRVGAIPRLTLRRVSPSWTVESSVARRARRVSGWSLEVPARGWKTKHLRMLISNREIRILAAARATDASMAIPDIGKTSCRSPYYPRFGISATSRWHGVGDRGWQWVRAAGFCCCQKLVASGSVGCVERLESVCFGSRTLLQGRFGIAPYSDQMTEPGSMMHPDVRQCSPEVDPPKQK